MAADAPVPADEPGVPPADAVQPSDQEAENAAVLDAFEAFGNALFVTMRRASRGGGNIDDEIRSAWRGVGQKLLEVDEKTT